MLKLVGLTFKFSSPPGIIFSAAGKTRHLDSSVVVPYKIEIEAKKPL